MFELMVLHEIMENQLKSAGPMGMQVIDVVVLIFPTVHFGPSFYAEKLYEIPCGGAAELDARWSFYGYRKCYDGNYDYEFDD